MRQAASPRVIGLPSAAPLGVRAQRKHERRSAIKAAAWSVFRSKGWEGATTREIAKRAGVATGTLFLYARDKRDLLLMIVNDDLEGVTDATFAALDSNATFLDNVITLFRARFVFWAESGLSRSALEEAFTVSGSSRSLERQRFDLRRVALIARIAESVAREQSAGRLRKSVRANDIAGLFMTLYRGELLNWLNDEHLDVETGVARLRTYIQIASTGF